VGDQTKQFGEVAINLARNPLGIIALFIVLVYGFASLVTAFAGSFTADERLPLIYFLVLFPVLVLAVFGWLVSRHSGKLFAPGDFKHEENYVQMQLMAVGSLARATAKDEHADGETRIEELVQLVRTAAAREQPSRETWRHQILWVDDRPQNNVYERKAFEAVGLTFTLALSTDDALDYLSKLRFAAIISDMGRREGPREGYVLLDAIRRAANRTPLFFYASSNSPEHKRETFEHGGQGCGTCQPW
jgi:CheY-like chemotaxis protein